MTYDGGGPYRTEDLTPGTFMVGETLKVNTDSLMTSGQSLSNMTSGFFGASMAAPLSLIKSDYGKDIGGRAIGNHSEFHETVNLANYLSAESGAAAQAEKLSQDLLFGCLAMANVAMVMSEKYGATDGFNACQNADAVADAFNPPSDAKGGTLAEAWGKAETDRAERNRLANLPQVDPYDVKYYAQSGLVEGRDYVVRRDEPAPLPGTEEPLYDGDPSNGEDVTPKDDRGKGESNPYYKFDGENDYDPDRQPYVPEPPMDDDTTTLAPGADWQSGSGNHSTTTMA